MTQVRFNNRHCMPAHTDYGRNQNLMNLFFNDFGETGRERFVPSANIVETADNFRIELSAPGFSRNDFKVKLENQILEISGEIETGKENQEEKYVRHEFSRSSFSRRFRLSNWVDSGSIAAKYENGILMVTIPKVEEAKSKPAMEIEIG